VRTLGAGSAALLTSLVLISLCVLWAIVQG
jgi:hypothetical protein